MAVVKANAYGHGLIPTALCLADADAFAVARLDEALALRGAGVRKPIVLLEGVFNAEQLAEAARQNLEIVVHEREQLVAAGAGTHGHRFVVWLKIDTGMNRLGFRASQVDSALAALTSMGERLLELRLLTHFASCGRTRQPADCAAAGAIRRAHRRPALRAQPRQFCRDIRLAAVTGGLGATWPCALWGFAICQPGGQ